MKVKLYLGVKQIWSI